MTDHDKHLNAQRRIEAAAGRSLRQSQSDDSGAARRHVATWDLSADAERWHDQQPETD